MLGPIDYIVVGFRGASFDGSILEQISKAVKHDIIRVVDLVFIMKDENGDVLEAEYDDQSEELKAMFGEMMREEGTPLLAEGDIDKIGKQMDKDTAAGVLVIEHLWAKGLKQALMDAGGFLIADGRVHPEAAEAAMADVQKMKA